MVDPAEVVRRNPEVILASWCGRKVRTEQICSRPGWNQVSAVRMGHVYAIPSDVILQPGPASLTEGVRQVHAAIARTMRQP
jgi:iron complex transport system substrate-binding protein